MFTNNINRLLTNIGHVRTRQQGIVSWKDKLFVNHLRVPKFMRIHGPTGEEVTQGIDLSGKKCLITGGTSGIGAELTRCLIARNCDVLMACRNPYAAKIASKNLWGDPDRLTTYKTNLTSLASVKDSCNRILDEQKKIDIVILNAAVFGVPWTLTEDGLETIFQVNYLSQYFMLLNLESILAPDARVVFMSSESHRNISWSFRDTISPSEEMLSLPRENYTSIKAYNVSKLCGILCMHYLAHRWLNQGKSIFCVHPGSFIKTNLCSNWWVYEALYTLMIPFSKSIEQAASTPLYCATSPQLQGFSDAYFKDSKETDESDLAKNKHLSFRIIDLTLYMLKERITLQDEMAEKVEQVEYAKHDDVKPETIKVEQTQEEHVLSA